MQNDVPRVNGRTLGKYLYVRVIPRYEKMGVSIEKSDNLVSTYITFTCIKNKMVC